MLYAGLITLREGVEASLIIAIVLSYLSRIGQQRGHRVVLGGASLALFLSVASAAGLQLLTLDLPKAAQEATEGLTMLFAVAVLTWMLVWMRRQAVSLGGHLRAQVDQALQHGSLLALGLLAFTAVGREGLETVLFLLAGAGRSGPSTLYWAAALAGLLGAAMIGAVVYSGAARLPLRVFFDVTGVILIVLAGGLLVNGLKELHEGGLLPGLGPRVWDTYDLLPDNFGLGALLSAVVGYDASPFLGQVVPYAAYIPGALALFFAGRGAPVAAKATTHAVQPRG